MLKITFFYSVYSECYWGSQWNNARPGLSERGQSQKFGASHVATFRTIRGFKRSDSGNWPAFRHLWDDETTLFGLRHCPLVKICKRIRGSSKWITGSHVWLWSGDSEALPCQAGFNLFKKRWHDAGSWLSRSVWNIPVGSQSGDLFSMQSQLVYRISFSLRTSWRASETVAPEVH